MKKILNLTLVFFLVALVALLTACGGRVSGSEDGSDTVVPKDTGEAIEGAFKLTVEDADGKMVSVGVDEDPDLASYVIYVKEKASGSFTEMVENFVSNISKKTGVELLTDDDFENLGKAIIFEIDSKMGVDDYSITKSDDKIYITARLEETFPDAAELFVKYFVYGTNKSLLVPAGRGYTYKSTYPINQILIDGVDIREFEVYSDPINKTGFEWSTVHEKVAEVMNEYLGKSVGVNLAFANAQDDEENANYASDGRHNIIVHAVSSNVNDYSITVEGGDVYFTGSYLSVQKAAKVFCTEIIGCTDEPAETGLTLEVESSLSREGSMGLTVPYTKDELLSMFEEAYERDDMIISGTHVWDGSLGGTNGTGIGFTEKRFDMGGNDVSAILELEVTKTEAKADDEITFEAYDLSKLVSEALLHVSKGGIISVCVHVPNPYGSDRYINNKRYTGYVGGDEGIKAMITEGTEDNEKLRAVLETTLRLFEALNENGIPFMIRPMHEQNADWFWWCILNENISSETYASLWRYFHGLVTKELGITDVIWVYSPTCNSSSDTKVDVMYPYPGDEYVDIVGEDWYTEGELEYNYDNGYEKLMASGKPVALCEYGPAYGSHLMVRTVEGDYYYNYTGKDIMNDFNTMLANGHKIAYFMTWTWNGSIARIEDADVVLKDPIVYTRNDMAEYWENN